LTGSIEEIDEGVGGYFGAFIGVAFVPLDGGIVQMSLEFFEKPALSGTALPETANMSPCPLAFSLLRCAG
jgi:hypothetical protein